MAPPTTAAPTDGEPATHDARPAEDTPPADGAAQRVAWPRVDAPDTVAPGVPFDLVVGLRPDEDTSLFSSSGAMSLPSQDVELEIRVQADGFVPVPTQTSPTPSLQHTLTVDDVTPFPTVTIRLLAIGGDELRPDRAIAVTFRRGGALVGTATALVRVQAQATPTDETTETDAAVSGRDAPDGRATGAAGPREAFALLPLEELDEVDLTIVARTGADVAGERIVFDAYSPLVDVAAPGTGDQAVFRLGETPEAFLGGLCEEAAEEGAPRELLAAIWGRGRRLGRGLPPFVVDAVRAVVAARAPAAPTLLLLTDDWHVPWELAVLSERDTSDGFGDRDEEWLLGERCAVGRWHHGDPPPPSPPPPATEVTVATALTADYDEVKGGDWQPLPEARGEVDDLAARLGDALVETPPDHDHVMRVLSGEDPVDLLHVALHGRFAAGHHRSGLVLLADPPEGDPDPRKRENFLTANHVRAGRLPRRPAVFLNACRAGRGGDAVFGRAVGLVPDLLAIGASAVVAPMWNVDDAQARATADAYYGNAGGDSGAELLRRRRVAALEAAATASDTAPLTDLAYQFFGSPRHRLRLPGAGGDDDGTGTDTTTDTTPDTTPDATTDAATDGTTDTTDTTDTTEG